MSTQVFHDDLGATLGYEAVAYSIVTKYLRTAKFNSTMVPSNPDACSHHLTSPHLDDSDKAILAIFEEKPFSSVREFP
jgi:hypothetical protein